MDLIHLLGTLLADIALAAIPAVGFALLFNVPRRALVYCAAGGALGHGLRFILLQYGVPIEWATLIAASIVSFVGVYWAQKLQAHPKVFTVAAIIPMIPGKQAFTAMLALFEMHHQGTNLLLLTTLADSSLKVFFITVALAGGLAMPGLLFYRRRPVV
jgi:uncharacterized membrane protein YjjB (DUF3815 family)